ncbi:MAG: ATP-binding cassette domain-containing protein [Verrucomicrobia bacterium]|nr:ATP-binding cassette domain-containing protein [Verrucomicrobiota bacterium]
MIEVKQLTKRYARHVAVEEVSFSVQRGEIVGLLGPNGAGKSTIMRILTGYIPATSGTVRVAGFDVFSQAQEVHRRLGYMPENNPLYRDMRVGEYLWHRARLKGLTRARCRERVGDVIEQFGLADVARRLIGHLSKGYQQRVGLADALVHEPELIVLDEPTLGLDPNQLRTVRQLIRDLARHHTVLISTHILPEVEITCTRVLILHLGRILAADTVENLQHRAGKRGQIVAEFQAPLQELKAVWDEWPEVEHADVVPADGSYVRCSLTARPGADLRPAIFLLAVRRGWPLRELTRTRHSLEDIFVRVTRPEPEEET